MDGAATPIRIFLVDDHVALSLGLAFYFSQAADLAVVASAATVAEACKLLADGLEVDVVLLDLQLPDGSGLDLIPEFSAASRGVSVIVLSGAVTDRAWAMAVAAGAAGVLDKAAATPAVIAEHVRAVYRGEPLISPAEAVALVANAEQLRRDERVVRGALASLTPREREILQAVADGASDKAIADRFFLSVGTVRNHVAGILRKLEVDSRMQAVILANRFGVVRLR